MTIVGATALDPDVHKDVALEASNVRWLKQQQIDRSRQPRGWLGSDVRGPSYGSNRRPTAHQERGMGVHSCRDFLAFWWRLPGRQSHQALPTAREEEPLGWRGKAAQPSHADEPPS